MNKVILTENKPGAESFELLVSNRALKDLENLQYYGGFLRFHIDLYSDNEKGKTDKSGIYKFLNNIF